MKLYSFIFIRNNTSLLNAKNPYNLIVLISSIFLIHQIKQMILIYFLDIDI